MVRKTQIIIEFTKDFSLSYFLDEDEVCLSVQTDAAYLDLDQVEGLLEELTKARDLLAKNTEGWSEEDTSNTEHTTVEKS